MCSGMNQKRIGTIYEAELKQRLADAMAKDKSHTEALAR